MTPKDGMWVLVGGVFFWVTVNDLTQGKALNKDLANMAKLTVTVLTSGDTGVAADGNKYGCVQTTGKEVRAFAPAIRKPSMVQTDTGTNTDTA